MQERSDEQLVALVLQGEDAAFEILVNRYQKQVFALAYRLGGDYDEARDIAQEAFLRIYQELNRFDLSRRFFPWMYRVAHNTCINLLQKRPREVTPLDQVTEARDQVLPHSPVASYELKERSEMLQAALQALPTSYREPLVLKYLEGFSYKQISEIMDLPITTIEARLFRGRNMLKQVLAEYIE